MGVKQEGGLHLALQNIVDEWDAYAKHQQLLPDEDLMRAIEDGHAALLAAATAPPEQAGCGASYHVTFTIPLEVARALDLFAKLRALLLALADSWDVPTGFVRTTQVSHEHAEQLRAALSGTDSAVKSHKEK
jgi:hypothetical protein